MSVAYSTGNVAIAVCDRCKFKYKYTQLRADGAVPGLRVCSICYDNPSPFLTWTAKPISYVLQYPRPDQGLVTEYLFVRPDAPVLAAQEYNYYRQVLSTDNDKQLQTQGVTPPDEGINQYIPPSLLGQYEE